MSTKIFVTNMPTKSSKSNWCFAQDGEIATINPAGFIGIDSRKASNLARVIETDKSSTDLVAALKQSYINSGLPADFIKADALKAEMLRLADFFDTGSVIKINKNRLSEV